MAENNPPKGSTVANGEGIPFYEKQRQHLKELITRKRAVEKRIVSSRPLEPAGAVRMGSEVGRYWLSTPNWKRKPTLGFVLVLTERCAAGQHRRRDPPEGDRLPREHPERKHHHGLRQLYEGHRHGGGAEAQDGDARYEPRLFTQFHLIYYE